MPMMEGWKPYDFSEPPFLGIIKMLDVQQSWNLYDKVMQNDGILRGERVFPLLSLARSLHPSYTKGRSDSLTRRGLRISFGHMLRSPVPEISPILFAR